MKYIHNFAKYLYRTFFFFIQKCLFFSIFRSAIFWIPLFTVCKTYPSRVSIDIQFIPARYTGTPLNIMPVISVKTAWNTVIPEKHIGITGEIFIPIIPVLTAHNILRWEPYFSPGKGEFVWFNKFSVNLFRDGNGNPAAPKGVGGGGGEHNFEKEAFLVSF